jgi:hypothetical protein
MTPRAQKVNLFSRNTDENYWENHGVPKINGRRSI